MKSFAITLFVILIPGISLFSQNKHEPLTENERNEVVNALAGQLNENYVFPETGEKMSKLLQTKLQTGEYESIYDPIQFSEQLTSDLHSIIQDKHLRVLFTPERIAAMRNTTTPEDSLAFVQRELATIVVL